MSAALAIGLVGLLALSGSARGRSARLRFDTSGSRSVFLDENSKTRTQSVPNQSFTRSAVLSPAEASRKALSELRSMGGAHRPPEAVDALRVVTAGHKKVLWIDMVKVNREAKGRGLGAAAAGRVETWGVEQGGHARLGGLLRLHGHRLSAPLLGEARILLDLRRRRRGRPADHHLQGAQEWLRFGETMAPRRPSSRWRRWLVSAWPTGPAGGGGVDLASARSSGTRACA